MTGSNKSGLLSGERVDLLNRTPVGHLATADADGRPHVIPFCFVCLEGTIYSVLDAKPKTADLRRLRRVRNIMANPQVSIIIDHYEPDWTKLWYLLIQGTAELLEPGSEHASALGALRSKYPQYRHMALDDAPMIKIVPNRTTGWEGA